VVGAGDGFRASPAVSKPTFRPAGTAAALDPAPRDTLLPKSAETSRACLLGVPTRLHRPWFGEARTSPASDAGGALQIRPVLGESGVLDVDRCEVAELGADGSAGHEPGRCRPARSRRNAVATVDGGVHHWAVHDSLLIDQEVGPMWLPGR
jgi:hypothetical protein